MEDCDCFVERKELERSLTQTNEVIKMKKCLSCSQPIYNLRRYYHLVSLSKDRIQKAFQKSLPFIDRNTYKILDLIDHLLRSKIMNDSLDYLKLIHQIFTGVEGKEPFGQYKDAIIRKLRHKSAKIINPATIALLLFQASTLDKFSLIQKTYETNNHQRKALEQVDKLQRPRHVIENQMKNILRVIFSIEDHFPISYLTNIVHEIKRLGLFTNPKQVKEENRSGKTDRKWIYDYMNLNRFEIELPKTFGFNEFSWLTCPLGHVYHKDEIDEEIEISDEYLKSKINCIQCFRTEKAKGELIRCLPP